MIDSNAACGGEKRLFDFPEEDNEKISGLSRASASTLSKRLKENCTGEEDDAIFAAAAFTVYRDAL